MISVLIPIQNEKDNLAPLFADLAETFKDCGPGVEFLFVDDGSTDGSRELLRELREADYRVRVLSLPGPSGQSAALWAGICAARGGVLASLDGDLQYDSADIVKLLEKLDGADMVCGWRRVRADKAVKVGASRFANAFRRLMLGDDIRDAGCTLRIWKREALEGIMPFNGFHRFLPVLCSLAGKKVEQVEVAHKPRLGGRSHYGIWRRAVWGLADTLGVRWLGKRKITATAVEN